ncbi:PAAR domain-containing protein [Shimwellia pseudoproteus]|uniref:PAAR domain-containing protein n=1 Tax=Shimwellia pseudoproteus TaxID=570012 RepID=UPI001E3AD530|nr:PAAR domain-containing protein [Shimwellia pseudoproteus]
MAKGYVLCQGDKTTCGGKIISGNPNRIAHARPIARHGDSVTCGKYKGQYTIVGGIRFMTDVEGDSRRAIAGTLDSVSSCPCRSTFIVTKYPAIQYENEIQGPVSTAASSATQSITRAVGRLATAAIKANVIPVFAKSSMRGNGNTDAGEQREPHTHFADMAFYQSLPPTDPPSDNDVIQHA